MSCDHCSLQLRSIRYEAARSRERRGALFSCVSSCPSRRRGEMAQEKLPQLEFVIRHSLSFRGLRVGRCCLFLAPIWALFFVNF